ncbi:MAG: extracellular solute-binding protein [Treponema sp.]|jgi:ABC-type glycerol-3-phosphate transport system substrate-binding protein|nr:extracellular solute-binding protein [Treponema sp.]
MTNEKTGQKALTRGALVMCILFLSAAAGWAAGARDSGQAAPSSGAAGSGKISDRERTLSVLISDNANQPIKNMALAQQAILEKTNIRIDFQIVPASNYNDKKSALLATNQMPEVSFITGNDITRYAPTGLFLPLEKYVNSMPNFKRFWDTIPDLKKSMIGGELYGFQMVARNEASNGFGPVIRTDLLAKHSIPIPTTFDELLDALESLKRIYPNSRPYSLRNGATLQHFKTSAYMLGSGFGSNGLYYDFDVDGGKYIFGPATKEFKTVLKFFADAYRRGVLDPDYATTTSSQFQAKMTGGTSFFFNDNSGFSIDYTNLLRKIEPDASLEFIPYLTNSYGQRRAVAYATTLNDRFFAIRADIKDPDTIIRFFDWLYSDEGSDITNYGKEGVSFRYNAQGKPEFIKEYIDRFKDKSPVYYAVFSDAGITKLNFSLYAGNTEQSFAIQKLAGVWDDFADKYWALAAKENLPGTGALVQPVQDPPLSETDAERVKDLTLAVTTYLEQEYNKYIMGVEPIDNWDRVITRAIELGANELADIYNRANAPFKK